MFNNQISMKKYIIIGIVSLFFLSSFPAFAQTVNCQTGCTVTVTPNPVTQPSVSNTYISGPNIGGYDLGAAIQNGLQQLANFFTGLEGTSIPQNNIVSTNGIQNATGAGFNVIGDLFKTGFDASTFVADLINSFELFHVSFWIVTIISIAITFFFIIRTGEDVIKRILIVLAIVTMILALLWFIFVYLNL